MNNWMFVVAVAAIGGSILLLLVSFGRAWKRWHGVRVITCPENHEATAVRVAAFEAAKDLATGATPDLHLRTCTRWPEMAGCDEACIQQIREAPEASLVQNIVGNWYDGKYCVLCDKEIGEVVWHERPPAVKLEDGTIREWKELPAETLPKVFATGEPVCWSCAIFENFRSEHPELVVPRPMKVPEAKYSLPPSDARY